MSVVDELLAEMAPTRKGSTLRNLKINEVSVVDTGANPGARIVLLKRADPRADGDNQEFTRMRETKATGVLPDNLETLVTKGLDAVLVKDDAAALHKTCAWLKLHSQAYVDGAYSVAKRLESEPPSVSDVDTAIGELVRNTQKSSESYYDTYSRVILSPIGKELYSLRTALVQAGDDPQVYARHCATMRENREAIAKRREGAW